MAEKPRINHSESQKSLDETEKQFDAYEKQIKDMTLDRMNAAPKEDVEPQTKMSSKDIEKSKDLYLKPDRSIGPGVNSKTGEREKFNEKFREDYNFKMEYVRFIAENREIIGETIELWTKPFPGMNLEFWKIPTNKPVWGPRHLAEQLTKCNYHRLKMEQSTITGADGYGTYHGGLTVDSKIQRLDATPVSARKSVFTGATNF